MILVVSVVGASMISSPEAATSPAPAAKPAPVMKDVAVGTDFDDEEDAAVVTEQRLEKLLSREIPVHQRARKSKPKKEKQEILDVDRI